MLAPKDILHLTWNQDSCTWVFKCHKCTREQRWAPPHRTHGITDDEAKKVGWVYEEGKGWLCPFCNPPEDVNADKSQLQETKLPNGE
jgi:hypothetical protein